MFPVFVPIAVSEAKMFFTKVITFSYSFMMMVSSLQVIDEDLFTLRVSNELREPERPRRRSFNFSNSSCSAGLESTSLINSSMSAICFSVSSRRLRTETVVVVAGPSDVDLPETAVELSVEKELLVGLIVVGLKGVKVLPSVALVVDTNVFETGELTLSVAVLVIVVLSIELMVALPVVLSTNVLPTVLLMVEVPDVVPLVVVLPADVLAAVVLPSFVLPIDVLPSVVASSVIPKVVPELPGEVE